MLQSFLANWHWKQGKFEQAASYFESGQLWHEAAGCYEADGKLAKAAKLYVKARNPEAAARCYEQIGRWADAAKCHEKKKNWRGLARCYEYMGQSLKAGQIYERAGSLMAAAKNYERCNMWVAAQRCWNEMGRLDEGMRCEAVGEMLEKHLELIAHRTQEIDLDALIADPARLLQEIKKWKDNQKVEGGLTVKDVLQSLLVIVYADTFSMVIQDGRTLLYLGLGMFAEEANVRMMTPDAQKVVHEKYPRGAPVEL